MSQSANITKRSTMQEVLEAYPSAQRALFQRYHMGGCHSCGYEMNEVLEDVAGRHNITDMDEVLAFIREADEMDRKIQISPEEVSAAMKGGKSLKVIDVRTPGEWEVSRIPGTVLIQEELAREIMGWAKDTPMVFLCKDGRRSMDAASYFAGHGFTNTKSMTGGLDAWSQKVDPSVPRYEIARDFNTGRPVFRPLRAVVSEAEGCMTPKN